MPQKTSSAISDEVIRKYLYGMMQDKIASVLGTSEANVSNIIKKFKTEVSQKDVEVFVTLTRALSDGNISYVQIIPAIIVCNITQQLGMSLEDGTLSSFLSNIYTESKNNGTEPKMIVESAIRLSRLKPHDIPLENVPEYYENLILEIKSIEEKLEELRKEVIQKKEQQIKIDDEFTTQLEKTRTTIAILEEYHTNKKALEDMGVSINDISKMSKMLNQASVKEYDVSKIIECTAKEETFEERQSQLEENIRQLSEKEEYLKNNKEELENKTKSLKSHIQELENSADKLQKSIDIILDMEKQGVNPVQIIRWNIIQESSGVDLQQFEDELQKSSNMTNYITNKKSELQTLKNEITDLKSRVETLTHEKIKLGASIDEIKKITLKCLGEVEKKSIDSIASIEVSSKESIKLTSDTAKKELCETSHNTQKNLENQIFTFRELITKVSEFSEEIGRMDLLRSICDIISGSEGDPHEVHSSCITYLQKLKPWLQSQNADYSTISAVEDTIRCLKNEEERLAIHA